ncbi:MAG: hypothetical protein FD135_3146 [Comamonadaceae bacterium]|nr:MAG: hypothetical protein FD135_3146 [Comamonadaceae bacterium]
MSRRQFIKILAAGGVMAVLAACDGMPESALAPWLGPDQRVLDPRLRALSWALLAPNPHNLQAWVADVRTPGEISLHVDTRRLLPETDPFGRQVLIGCGAFLELLRMATLAGDALFAAVRQRRTQRSVYTPIPPQAAALAALRLAAEAAGITLGCTVEPEQVKRINAMALQGCRIEFGTAETWQESANSLRLGAQEVAAEPSGTAVLGTEVWLARSSGLLDHAALRDPNGIGATRALQSMTTLLTSGTPAWVWLSSADNSRMAQLEAGRSYLRLCLQATLLGLALHPNSQVLQEFAQMRTLLSQVHAELGLANPARLQMLVRIGYAANTAVTPSPRRPLSSLLQA